LLACAIASAPSGNGLISPASFTRAAHQFRRGGHRSGPDSPAGLGWEAPPLLNFDTGVAIETSRYRAVFERPSYVTRWRRTGWLGRQDSNLCIREFASRWLRCCRQPCPQLLGLRHRICCHSLGRMIAGSPNRACFLMRKFESCPPSHPVRSPPPDCAARDAKGDGSTTPSLSKRSGLRRLDRNVPIDAAYAGSLPFFF